MEEAGGVEGRETVEEVGRAGDKDAELVDCAVGWVKVAKLLEWRGGGGGVCRGVGAEEEGGGDALIDCVFGNVDEE